MKQLFLIALIIGISGCTSLNNAGVASYQVKPMELSNGKVVCCDIIINNGKEYSSLEAHVIKHGDNYEVHLNEVGIFAFEGQKIVAGVATETIKKAGSVAGGVLMAPVIAPAAGAVINGILK